MRKILLMLICMIFLIFASCGTKDTAHRINVSIPEGTTKAQANELYEKINIAVEGADDRPGEEEIFVPTILLNSEENNVEYRGQILQYIYNNDNWFSFADSPVVVGNYNISYLGVRTNISENDKTYLEESMQTNGYQYYEKDGIKYSYLASYDGAANSLSVWFCYFINDKNTLSTVISIPNQSEMNNELLNQVINDFGCISLQDLKDISK